MLNDKDLDSLIKKTYQDELENQQVPFQAYKNVGTRLGINFHSKTRIKRRKLAAVMVILLGFLLSTIYYFDTDGAIANGIQLIRQELQLEGTIMNIKQQFGQSEQTEFSGMPASDELIIPKDELVSLSEAQERVPFMCYPSYLPEDLKLQEIQLRQTEHLTQIVILFRGDSGILRLRVVGIADNYAMGLAYDIDDTQAKPVMVNGVEGNLLINKSGQVLLEWHNQGVSYQLLGDLNADEMSKIAESLAP